MTGKSAAAAAKKGSNRRLPSPQEARRSLRPRRRRTPISDDFADFAFTSSESEDERGRRKVKLVVKLPDGPAGGGDRRSGSPTPAPSSDGADSSSASACSTSSSDEDDAVKPLKKRRMINGCDDGGSGHRVEGKRNGIPMPKGRLHGVSLDTAAAAGTPLPERKALEAVLDRLQKKDTYSVFAEPVDSEELPDYYEVIEHPMDFGTVRKKLARKAYSSFEQFEDDVFLICSNAMQYNAPDTVYFRQARAIECMARKNFEILRADAKSVEPERKTEEKIKHYPMDKKLLKKSLCRVENEPIESDVSSSATLASAFNSFAGSNVAKVNASEQHATADGLSTPQVPQVVTFPKTAISDKMNMMRPKTLERHGTANGLIMPKANAAVQTATANGLNTTQSDDAEKTANANGFSKSQANGVDKPATSNGSTAQDDVVQKPATVGLIDCNSSPAEAKSDKIENKSDKTDDLSAKLSPSKMGKKPFMVDENRRATYNNTDQQLPTESSFVFDVFESEPKQLVSVGPHSEHSYARSLSRFAAFLGPIGWEIAAKRIEMALPSGVKFGPGWVGEYEPLPTPVLSFESQNQEQLRHGSNLNCGVASNNKKETKQRSKVAQVSNSKGMQLDPAVGGMPHRPSNQEKGTVLRGHKQNSFGVSAESQPRITGTLSRQQKDLTGFDITKAYANVPEEVDACTSPSVNSSSVEKVLRRMEFHPQAQNKRLFGVSAENSAATITNAMLPQQKDQRPIDFTRACNNISEQARVCNTSSVSSISVEKSVQRPQFHHDKQKPFGVSADTQQGVANMMLQQQRNQVTIDFTRSGTGLSEQMRMNHTSSPSNTPVEIALLRAEPHPQAQKNSMFGMPNEMQPRVANSVLQHQRGQVSIDFVKAYNNSSEQVGMHGLSPMSGCPVETALQRAECYSKVAPSRPIGMSSASLNKIRGEPQKQPVTVNIQRGSAALGLTVGELSDNEVAGSSANSRANTFEFFSNHQSGVTRHSVTRGSHEQAIDFKFMGLSGKNSETTKPAMSPCTHAKRDDPNTLPTVASTGAWMLPRASAEYRSVDGMGLPFRQTGSSSYPPNSAWRTPTSATRNHGDSMVRPLPQVLPHSNPMVAEESQFQNRMVIPPQLVPSDLSRFHGRSPWQDLAPHAQPRQRDMLPPDLNIGFPPPGSPVRPSSGILVDSQQPDLALQL